MSDKTQWILEFSVLIFLGVLALIVLTVWILHKLHDQRITTAPNKPILDAIEGVRQQQSAEHSAMQAEQRAQGGLLRSLLERFGFLRGPK